MNIINSFEASAMIMDSLGAIVRLVPTAYENFRVFKDGNTEYSDNCEDLK